MTNFLFVEAVVVDVLLWSPVTSRHGVGSPRRKCVFTAWMQPQTQSSIKLTYKYNYQLFTATEPSKLISNSKKNKKSIRPSILARMLQWRYWLYVRVSSSRCVGWRSQQNRINYILSILTPFRRINGWNEQRLSRRPRHLRCWWCVGPQNN